MLKSWGEAPFIYSRHLSNLPLPPCKWVITLSRLPWLTLQILLLGTNYFKSSECVHSKLKPLSPKIRLRPTLGIVGQRLGVLSTMHGQTSVIHEKVTCCPLGGGWRLKSCPLSTGHTRNHRRSLTPPLSTKCSDCMSCVADSSPSSNLSYHSGFALSFTVSTSASKWPNSAKICGCTPGTNV
jgi:hypothetical protein